MNECTYLHRQIRITHPTINSQLGQLLPTILLHRIQNGLRLKARRLQRRPRNMALLGIRGDAKNGAPRIIEPVRRIQPRKRRDEHHAAVVRHALGQPRDVLALVHELEVFHQELDARPRDGDAALERVHASVRAEVERDGGEQPVLGDDGRRAHVVQQEAARAVGVFCEAWLEAFLADERRGLVAEAAGYGRAFERGCGEGAVGGRVG